MQQLNESEFELLQTKNADGGHGISLSGSNSNHRNAQVYLEFENDADAKNKSYDTLTDEFSHTGDEDTREEAHKADGKFSNLNASTTIQR